MNKSDLEINNNTTKFADTEGGRIAGQSVTQGYCKANQKSYLIGQMEFNGEKCSIMSMRGNNFKQQPPEQVCDRDSSALVSSDLTRNDYIHCKNRTNRYWTYLKERERNHLAIFSLG